LVKLLLQYGITFKKEDFSYLDDEIQSLLHEASQDSVESKLIPYETMPQGKELISGIQKTLPSIPDPLIKIVVGYTNNYEFYGYFFKNSPKKQLFLKEDKPLPTNNRS